MSAGKILLIVLGGLIALALLIGLWGGGTYNRLVTLQQATDAQWAQVQNVYQRRADLVPNLVATVQGYAQQEKSVLTAVTEARARATAITVSPEQLDDPAKLRQLNQAQGELSQALGRLLAVTENYPDLKSNANFLALQSQLEGTENRIAIARRDYNQAVQTYNTRIRTFPDAIGAKIFYGAKPMATFEATTPNAEKAPTVQF